MATSASAANVGRHPTLGVIADDFTGATDVASMLVNAGMRTIMLIGVPRGAMPEADALIVALKSRTTPAEQAVAESLAAQRWLAQAGARRFYFKVCSTFDSTPKGNIGPVAEALLDALQSDFTIVCPAFPENGRTIFRGHLFVGDQLLSDSGMRNHPLTPMTESNLVSVLQAQCRRKVGLIRYDTIARGPQAVQQRIAALRGDGVALAIADALSNEDLQVLGAVCADWPLVTAGSGVALGLPDAYAQRGWITPDARAAQLDRIVGAAAVLSGSCSSATNEQVARWAAQRRPVFRVDPRELARSEPVAERALDWARERLGREAVLISATIAPQPLKQIQAELGVEHAGALVEACLAQVARGLVDAGVQRLVVAGGETSGAVVQALGVTTLRIGAAICPGVPWTQAEGRQLLLALKSGNFGGPDFFEQALEASAR